MDIPHWIIVAVAAAVVALAVVRAAVDRYPRRRVVFDVLGGVEVGAVVVLLGTLVLLGFTQIVLRNVAHTGLMWADPLMRHIVLWLGCLGGTLATARVRHINIDVLSRPLRGRARSVRHVVIHGATALVAFILGVAALRLVASERTFSDPAFAGLQTWQVQVILPFAFFLIVYRSIVNMLLRRESADGYQDEETAP